MNEALKLGRVACGHDINSYGKRLLGIAAAYRKEDIVSSLLEASVVKDGLHCRSQGLKVACNFGRVGVVELLLAGTGLSLASSEEGSTLCLAFKIAANACQLDSMSVLLRRSSASPIGNIDSVE